MGKYIVNVAIEMDIEADNKEIASMIAKIIVDGCCDKCYNITSNKIISIEKKK